MHHLLADAGKNLP